MAQRGRPPRLPAAQKEIAAYFDSLSRKAFTYNELENILWSKQDEWRLPASTTGGKFVRFLLEATSMREVSVTPVGQTEIRTVTRYAWANATPYAVAAILEPKGYLSHGTAVLLHGLSDQLPHTICVSREKSTQNYKPDALEQEAIDEAFRKPERLSNALFAYDNFQFVLLQGKSTGRLEVGTIDWNQERLPVTKLERTLIDITIRPAYAGASTKCWKHITGRSRTSLWALFSLHSRSLNMPILTIRQLVSTCNGPVTRHSNTNVLRAWA